MMKLMLKKSVEDLLNVSILVILETRKVKLILIMLSVYQVFLVLRKKIHRMRSFVECLRYK